MKFESNSFRTIDVSKHETNILLCWRVAQRCIWELVRVCSLAWVPCLRAEMTRSLDFCSDCAPLQGHVHTDCEFLVLRVQKSTPISAICVRLNGFIVDKNFGMPVVVNTTASFLECRMKIQFISPEYHFSLPSIIFELFRVKISRQTPSLFAA